MPAARKVAAAARAARWARSAIPARPSALAHASNASLACVSTTGARPAARLSLTNADTDARASSRLGKAKRDEPKVPSRHSARATRTSGAFAPTGPE